MRIANGDTNRKITFFAVDATDFTTPETGLSGFTVYYSVDGGSATAMTTPTVAELDATNMPGEYALSIDESGMVAIPASRDECEVALHISVSGMAPVPLVYELFRPKITEGEALVVSSGVTTVALQDDAISAGKFDETTAFPQTGDSYARLGAPAGASVSADIAGLPAATMTTFWGESGANPVEFLLAMQGKAYLTPRGWDGTQTLTVTFTGTLAVGGTIILDAWNPSWDAASWQPIGVLDENGSWTQSVDGTDFDFRLDNDKSRLRVRIEADSYTTGTLSITVYCFDNVERTFTFAVPEGPVGSAQAEWWGMADGTLAIFGGGSLVQTAPVATTADVPTAAATADAVWDEDIRPSEHGIQHSAAYKLWRTADALIYAGTAVSGTANTITLAEGDSAEDDGAYDPAIISIVAGTGVGQSRLILQYVGHPSHVAIVDRDWKVIPDGTSEVMITGDAGREHVNEGRAQAGGSNTITLNANASSDDDAYKGQIVFLRSGTGQDQARRVGSYNGTTKVATLTRDWAVQPDATTGYVMLPTGALSDECMRNAMWNATAADYNTAGTTGEALNDAAGGGGGAPTTVNEVSNITLVTED